MSSTEATTNDAASSRSTTGADHTVMSTPASGSRPCPRRGSCRRAGLSARSIGVPRLLGEAGHEDVRRGARARAPRRRGDEHQQDAERQPAQLRCSSGIGADEHGGHEAGHHRDAARAPAVDDGPAEGRGPRRRAAVSAKPTSPVSAGLPVVVRTNHGIATIDIRVPVVETTSAARKPHRPTRPRLLPTAASSPRVVVTARSHGAAASWPSA